MIEGDEGTEAHGTIETASELGLPRSADLEDAVLVDRAVHHIRAVLASTVSRGMEEVGRYLLEEFFDNDPRLYFSTAPKKHASLRLLIARAESLDLPVSRTFLGNALRVAAASKELPREAAFHELPASHRVELVRLREPEKVERLAAQAVERNLSVQKVRELVKREATKGKRSTRGRRPTPPVLRAIDHCLRLLRDEETGRLLFLKSDVSGLTDEQRERAETGLRSLEKRVAELRRILPEG
jgi:hypothetical protein